MIGRTVGNYRVVELLGTGGMGAVYRAEHPGIGRQAAIKVLHPQLAQSEEILVRFFNEARAANSIRHPGIVEIFDMGTLPDGATYIIMELLEGESLSARMLRGRIQVAQAVELAGQIASALGAAHAKGIVHRDLKPDNVFLVADPQNPGRDLVKILDFGIAKLAASPTGDTSGSVRTRTGVVMGTPLYMSPEQCRGTREIDHRSDIYALGVILYEMLCGRPPFFSTGHGELIHMHIAEPPTPPRQHNPEIPETLEAVVLRALAKEPGDRIQDMPSFLQALRTRTKEWGTPSRDTVPLPAVTRSGEPSPQTTLTSASASVITDADAFRPRRRWRWPLLLALAGAAGAIYYLRFREAPAPALVAEPPRSEPAPRPAPPPPAPIEPATIAVNISTVPPGASVIRVSDGARIGVTPFGQKWPRGTGSTKLRLELAGYEPEPVTVAVDLGDVELANVPLTRKAEPARPRASSERRPRPAASPKPAPRPAPAVPPPAPPPVTPPARVVPSEPVPL